MKGYIYTMFAGADPAEGWKMTDPIYGKVPTLGACMTNIRSAVQKDDYIFSISGRVKNATQYSVSGFGVDEKINALAAFDRFPENRMKIDENGLLVGNIIIDKNGKHLPIDYHTNHEERIKNYIVGKNPVIIEGDKQVEKARSETLSMLNDLFGTDKENISKIVGRWRKLNEAQVKDLLSWMNHIRKV
jgi:hypothetical protein